MANYNLSTLDPMKFTTLIPTREAVIAQAPAAPLPQPDDFPVNALAQALHPCRQYLVVSAVRQLSDDCKCYELRPDPSRGTDKLAYFSAGQYVSVFLDVDGRRINRPYSICSSPRESLEGKYELAVKLVPGGIASQYILDNWQVGTKVEVSGPVGEFDYQPLRDARTVIGIAGGSGITPFLSFAKAIVDGEEDFNLTLLYGSRTEDGIIFREEFDDLAARCERIKVVHVLSDEEREGFEHGFITAELIRKYAPEGKYSVFLCGPQATISWKRS
ncbi:MAG: ferredoxin--NADP reductase [Oscillospiraceae bacterium]|jgi:ferredoxin-NADP reductase